ncbi:hypothetical protein BDA96_10G246000 [Sorghum bicolor]|uniref:Uncharacterized protein n=2 Tax=Sorghum bicolor TaxID=4558 RepID=A0A921U1Y2_SORBI|nr:hypothetical protein BDA96_10G246000 [Sorghum bicolor]OQU76686.1 hypothetical protein SORBI_3010G187950 [Sorghum bicolor]
MESGALLLESGALLLNSLLKAHKVNKPSSISSLKLSPSPLPLPLFFRCTFIYKNMDKSPFSASGESSFTGQQMHNIHLPSSNNSLCIFLKKNIYDIIFRQKDTST